MSEFSRHTPPPGSHAPAWERELTYDKNPSNIETIFYNVPEIVSEQAFDQEKFETGT